MRDKVEGKLYWAEKFRELQKNHIYNQVIIDQFNQFIIEEEKAFNERLKDKFEINSTYGKHLKLGNAKWISLY